METKLCARCGELVPQGCCTCGDKRELVPVNSRSPELTEVLAMELGRMLSWHDAIREEAPIILPSPWHIEESRAAHTAWKNRRRE